jgi:hypothetical protein
VAQVSGKAQACQVAPVQGDAKRKAGLAMDMKGEQSKKAKMGGGS